MKLLYKLLKKNPDSREGIITATSCLSIAVSGLISAAKIAVGILASSIAIITEGVNNAADAVTSVITILGTRLAGKHPDKKHPFGYGRIEYLTGLVIAVLISYTGIDLLISSISLAVNPEELSISCASVIIIAVSAVIKYFLGTYTVKMGKKALSTALEGVGRESRNDSAVSVITIISAMIFLIFGISLDAYAGMVTSLLIVKTGFGILRSSVSELLGRPAGEELAGRLYAEIRSTDGVLAAADMMLHNYGPDSWSGTVNIEVDNNKTAGEIYCLTHELQSRIMHEYDIAMVFGVCPAESDRKQTKALRAAVSDYIATDERIRSFHALYIDTDTDSIYCDVIVDHAVKDRECVRTDLGNYIKKLYPESKPEITVETEYI